MFFIGGLLVAFCTMSDGLLASSHISLGWDALAPGTQVRGLTEKPVAGSATAESRIYVSSAAAVSSPNCLAYDFSDWPAGKSRGYPEISFPSMTNGWTVFSLCFRHESGSVSGEIRGFYNLPGETFCGVKRTWPFLWLTFDEIFSVRIEGQKRWQTIRVGSVLPHVWHRVQIAIPPCGTADAVGRVRLERMDAKGEFSPVASADLPFGKLTLRRATSFDLTGIGPCKFFFDDLSLKERKSRNDSGVPAGNENIQVFAWECATRAVHPKWRRNVARQGEDLV